jgi:hypothetical protein
VPAPAKSSTASVTASGLPIKTRKSRVSRPGNVVRGNETVAPETMNTPITAAYVIRQTMHTALITKNDA